MDKKNIIIDSDIEESEETKKQNEIGSNIDEAFKREKFLRDNQELFPIDDYTKILYRLPITEEQRKNLYELLLKEHNTSSEQKKDINN